MHSKFIRGCSSLLTAFGVTFAAMAQSPDPPAGTDYTVSMRDGVRLGTTVFLPGGDGTWPVIVTRTPYNKARYPKRAPRYT